MLFLPNTMRIKNNKKRECLFIKNYYKLALIAAPIAVAIIILKSIYFWICIWRKLGNKWKDSTIFGIYIFYYFYSFYG